MNRSSILITASAFGLVTACTHLPDFTSEMTQLDSLLAKVEEGHKYLNEIDSARVQMLIDTVKYQMNFLEENYTGEMDKALAMKISQYRMVKRKMPDFASRYRTARAEALAIKNQLMELRKAMAIKATRDAHGNKMTPQYYQSQLELETKLANSWLSEQEAITHSAQFIQNRYDSLAAELGPVFASIPPKKKP